MTGLRDVRVHARQLYIVDPDLGADQAPDIADAGNGLIAAEEDGASILTGLTGLTGRGHCHHTRFRATAPRG
ncbi:hypothetical protein ACIRP2_39000 [Streptomyces sp. NPDC101194]|uniref:hypothetical protein n=1 Tax=Streptomyces sp. NPDC101194 TaxID=3366127 RepID=UPI00381241A9